jgi:hypothetical protein
VTEKDFVDLTVASIHKMRDAAITEQERADLGESIAIWKQALIVTEASDAAAMALTLIGAIVIANELRAERDQCRAQLQTIGRKAFWAAKDEKAAQS